MLRLLALNRRLWIVMGLALAIIMIGTVGYVVIEGWNWQDALFMTVITLSTVGYGETRPLDPSGRLFTVGPTFLGVCGTASTLTAVSAGSRAHDRSGSTAGHSHHPWVSLGRESTVTMSCPRAFRIRSPSLSLSPPPARPELPSRSRD